MKLALLLLGTGLVALVAQGALAGLLPPPFCPDLGLLVVIAIGLRWEGLASGLCIAAALGFAADLLSGSLLGQHAMMRIFAFLGSRIANRQLNLRGAAPLVIFTVGASFVYGVMLLMLTSYFNEVVEGRLAWLGSALLHAPMNAILAPSAVGLVESLIAWMREDEGGRRTLRLDPQRRVA